MRKAKEKSEFENMIRFQMPGRGAGKMQIQVNRQGGGLFWKTSVRRSENRKRADLGGI